MSYEESVEQEFMQAIKEMQEAGRCVTMQMDCVMITSVVSQLHLALRHPANRGASTGVVLLFITNLIAQVAATDPMVAVLLRRGMDTRFDKIRFTPEGAAAFIAGLYWEGQPSILVDDKEAFRKCRQYAITRSQPPDVREQLLAAIDALDRYHGIAGGLK